MPTRPEFYGSDLLHVKFNAGGRALRSNIRWNASKQQWRFILIIISVPRPTRYDPLSRQIKISRSPTKQPIHIFLTLVAHKMLCTPWLRNPLTISRLSCLGRKATLATIFLSVRQSTISHPWCTNNYSRLLKVTTPQPSLELAPQHYKFSSH
jgi:hypothetical protein